MFQQIVQKYPKIDGFMNILVSENIEIYGEEHNEKLSSFSVYSKILNFLNKHKLSKNQPLVLLEHPSVLCKFHNKEEIKNFRKYGYGGINYLFLKLIQSYSSIKCVDTRMELGYLMAIQEKQLLSTIQNVNSIKEVENCLQIFNNLKNEYELNYEYYTYHNIIYNLYLQNKNEMEEKITVLEKSIKQLKKTKRKKDIEMLKGLLLEIFYKCRDLSSFSVDVYIISIILNNPDRKIFVFCGNKHLFRLFFLLNVMTDIQFKLINDKAKEVKITKKKPLHEHFTNWKNIDYSL